MKTGTTNEDNIGQCDTTCNNEMSNATRQNATAQDKGAGTMQIQHSSTNGTCN
jgi:hypothetical protein